MGGGDKALITIGGTAILDRVMARLQPATTAIILKPKAIRPGSRAGTCPWSPSWRMLALIRWTGELGACDDRPRTAKRKARNNVKL